MWNLLEPSRKEDLKDIEATRISEWRGVDAYLKQKKPKEGNRLPTANSNVGRSNTLRPAL